MAHPHVDDIDNNGAGSDSDGCGVHYYRMPTGAYVIRPTWIIEVDEYWILRLAGAIRFHAIHSLGAVANGLRRLETLVGQLQCHLIRIAGELESEVHDATRVRPAAEHDV